MINAGKFCKKLPGFHCTLFWFKFMQRQK